MKTSTCSHFLAPAHALVATLLLGACGAAQVPSGAKYKLTLVKLPDSASCGKVDEVSNFSINNTSAVFMRATCGTWPLDRSVVLKNNVVVADIAERGSRVNGVTSNNLGSIAYGYRGKDRKLQARLNNSELGPVDSAFMALRSNRDEVVFFRDEQLMAASSAGETRALLKAGMQLDGGVIKSVTESSSPGYPLILSVSNDDAVAHCEVQRGGEPVRGLCTTSKFLPSENVSDASVNNQGDIAYSEEVYSTDQASLTTTVKTTAGAQLGHALIGGWGSDGDLVTSCPGEDQVNRLRYSNVCEKEGWVRILSHDGKKTEIVVRQADLVPLVATPSTVATILNVKVLSVNAKKEFVASVTYTLTDKNAKGFRISGVGTQRDSPFLKEVGTPEETGSPCTANLDCSTKTVMDSASSVGRATLPSASRKNSSA